MILTQLLMDLWSDPLVAMYGPWKSPGGSGRAMDDALLGRHELTEKKIRPGRHTPFPPGPGDADGWAGVQESLEPAIRRMADGGAYRVDRLRALGNGVVPVQAALAFLHLWITICPPAG